MSAVSILDYCRSFAINTSAKNGEENNTCRTQLLSRCSLPDDTGRQRDYFLGKECIGEYMYQDGGIAQVPTAEVCVIFNVDESSLLKKFANHQYDVIQAGELTVARKGFDGSYANWTALRFIHRRSPAHLLKSVDAIIEATLAGKPLIGRTTLATGAGTKAVLEYPISYMNVHPPEGRFQVDVGPILYPDGSSTAELMVQRFHLAYVMYNELDEAEFALRLPTRVSESVQGETLHYSKIITTPVRHELFSLVG